MSYSAEDKGMTCSFCGLPIVAGRWHLCCGSIPPQPVSLPLAKVSTTRTATSNATITSTFALGDCLPPAAASLPQVQPGAQPADSFITCARCQQQRPAEHTAVVRFAQPLVSAHFLCGPCLDELAESLYLQCAKQGVPHWRRQGG